MIMSSLKWKSGEKRRREKRIFDDLECEEEIIEEKARFGKVRNSLMKGLRARYGKTVADRARWRVNRRLSSGYLIGSDHKEAEGKATEVLSRLLDKKDLVEREDRKAEAEEARKAEVGRKAEEATKDRSSLKPLSLR